MEYSENKEGDKGGEIEIHTRLIIRQKLKQQLLYSPDLSEKEKFIEYSVMRVPIQWKMVKQYVYH